MLLEIQAEMLNPCSVDPDVVKGSEAIYGGVYWLSVGISYVAQLQDLLHISVLQILLTSLVPQTPYCSRCTSETQGPRA